MIPLIISIIILFIVWRALLVRRGRWYQCPARRLAPDFFFHPQIYRADGEVLRLPDGTWRIWYASRTKPPFVHKYFAIGSATWKGPVE